MFLRNHLEEGVYQVSAVSASNVLKRNTDSLRCAVENDMFASLPQDSLLDEQNCEWCNPDMECEFKFIQQWRALFRSCLRLQIRSKKRKIKGWR